MDIDIIKMRSQMNRIIREFFDGRGFLEVETPLLSPDLIPESAIEIFRTEYESNPEEYRELYLIPSPEIWMKKLLSSGVGSCYQICRSFRNREQKGRIHNPEFTMLEWYETGSDYFNSMDRTEELFGELSFLSGDKSLGNPFQRISMAEAFREFTGEEIEPWCRPGQEGMDAMSESFKRLDMSCPPGKWEESFNLIFVHLVEPRLPKGSPLILYDYPSNIPTLAAVRDNTPLVPAMGALFKRL